jgi:multiple sugar transport system permease protein
MASSATSSIALAPESTPLRYYSGKISRFLLKDRTLGYLFLAPALLVILVLVIYPFVGAVFLTFQEKTAGAPGTWIGLNNYRELLSNEVFSRTVYNSIFYTVIAVALKFVFGLGMALVLNQERLFNNFFRSFLLIPWAIPTVISALNWRWIYDDASGLINNVLVRLELIDETISWLSDPSLAMFSVIAVVVWQGTPFFYHGLPGRPAVHLQRALRSG